MLGPLYVPLGKPREPCETQACVERRREVDTVALWAIALCVLGAIVVFVLAYARQRRRARVTARKRQAAHDRAQEDLKQLFAREDDDEK